MGCRQACRFKVKVHPHKFGLNGFRLIAHALAAMTQEVDRRGMYVFVRIGMASLFMGRRLQLLNLCDVMGRVARSTLGHSALPKAISEFQYFTFESAKSWGATSGLAGRARTNRPREPTYLRMPARPSSRLPSVRSTSLGSCN